MTRTLDTLAPGTPAAIAALRLPAKDAEWLRAVGLYEGTQVELLRRAPFGGPLHVRTASGAEFAVDAELAAHVELATGGTP
jgi:ferrous iron transport protein A